MACYGGDAAADAVFAKGLFGWRRKVVYERGRFRFAHSRKNLRFGRFGLTKNRFGSLQIVQRAAHSLRAAHCITGLL